MWRFKYKHIIKYQRKLLCITIILSATVYHEIVYVLAIYEKNYHVYDWSLQSFIKDYDLASRTTYVVCVNFIYERRAAVDYQRQIF